MSKIAFFFFIFFSALAMAQEYDHVDENVRNYPNFESIEDLAVQIQSDFDSDIERVRAAFVWLTHNITYGKTLDQFFKSRTRIIYYSERGKEQQLKKVLDERLKNTFKSKRGVCYDYSIMLKNLCDAFKVESEIVHGVIKEDVRALNGEKIYKNHVWNVVKLDAEWKLIDPTWASGYWDSSTDRFVREFCDHYFATNPKEFIKNHFPAETKWQLIDNPVTLNSFFTAPLFFSKYFENEIKLSPQISGLLTQSENLELVLAFEKIPFRSQLKYSIDSNNQTGKLRVMPIKKRHSSLFISKLKLKKLLRPDDLLTIYIDKRPVLKFAVNQ
ncbi:transglutaminase domain-containing protein [Flagellimonas sp.]|uniref:transglutaminase domain-containing protein n=1 Tax=Flagellimonas sp. TaxID=2058762 RepID=UPI003B5C9D6B